MCILHGCKRHSPHTEEPLCRAPRCEIDHTPFTSSPSASPSFHCKERNHSVLAFFENIPPPSPPTPLPFPYQPLPTAGRGTQTTTLSSQTLIVCACVCIFSPWHEEGEQSKYLCAPLGNRSPGAFELICVTERVEVAESSIFLSE